MLPVWLINFGLSAWKIIKELLMVTIPVPVFVILLIAGWWYIDKNSSIKRAVKEAVIQYVAGEVLAGKDAVITAQKALYDDLQSFADRQAQRAKDAQDATNAFQEQLSNSRLANQKLLERMNNDTAAQATKTDSKGKVCFTPKSVIDGVRK